MTVTVLSDEFNRILSGEQKELYREVRSINVGLYLQLDSDGYELEDAATPVQYQAILLQEGYDKNSRAVIISVTGISTNMLVDEDGELITFSYNNQGWIGEEVVYTMGPVLKNKVKRNRRDRSSI